MKDSDFQRLIKIRGYCDEIKGFLDNCSLESFLGDLKTLRAVSMALTQIGELSYKLSDEFKSAHAEQPWNQIAGLRHRLVHDYVSIDFNVIWEISQNNITKLNLYVKSILENLK